jgi:UDP-MurNAc hydroxylase
VKFTIVSHAGLYVETDDCSIVMDPWLVGSCYWRSWWNYPPPSKELVASVKPDYVYLTHLHWDHFHGPSLRRFDRSTTILVPEAHFDRMVVDLNSIGFDNVIEIPHAGSVSLGGKTTLTSYQFGFALDSVAVVTDGEKTLVNANDCKIMGAPLRQLTKRHPKVDFLFRSHSSASAFPFCVTSYNPDHLTVRPPERYMQEFLAFANRVKATYAVPFASNACFLHKETREFNVTAVSPIAVKEHFDTHNKTEGQCVVMIPGDSWSSESDYQLATHDYFTNKDQRLDELAEEHAATLEAHYEQEDAVSPHWPAFERYFTRLLKSLPWAVRRVFHPRVLYKVQSNPERYWMVDFGKRTVTQQDTDDGEYELAVGVHPAVLNDCVRKKMFSVFTASKRVRFEIRQGSLRNLLVLNSIMDMYEADYFPLSNWLSKRFIRNWLKRWREPLLYARLVFALIVLRRPVVVSKHI